MSGAVTLKGNAKIAFENTPQIPVLNDLIFYVDAAVLGEDITLPYDTIVDFENLENMRSLFMPRDMCDRDFGKFSLEFAEGFGKKATRMDACFAASTFYASFYDSLATLILPKGCGGKAESLSNCFSCSSLSSLTLPEGFGKIATTLSACFFKCYYIKALTFPNGFGSMAGNLHWCFGSCKSLTSLHLPEGFGAVATDCTYCFSGCNVLSTITGGPQFKVSVSFSNCPLDNDSAVRIVNGLQEVTETQTITFSDTTKTNLTEAGLFDGLVETAHNKGWDVA